MRRHTDLTQGSVSGTLVRLAGAMLIGMFAMAAFNLTDAFFLAKLGTNELAAMGFTLPVAMVIGGLAMGLGVGVSAVLANLIGQGRLRDGRVITTDALLLGVGVVFCLVILGLSTMRPLFTMLGATEETLPLVEQYMRIWYLGVVFVIIPIVGNNAIRATGDTLWPSVIMMVGFGLNAGLDPLLIFGWGPVPAMGMAGAAWATVLSRAISMMASLYVLGARKHMLTPERPTWNRVRSSWKPVLRIGAPAAATHMLMPLSAGIVLKMVAWFGVPAVAAFTAATRLEMIFVLPLMAIGTSMIPFVGQNRGAGRFDRIRRGHILVAVFAIGWGLACAAALNLTAQPLADAFIASDPEASRLMAMILCIAPFAYGFRGLGHMSGGGMNAIDRPYDAWAVMVLRMFVLSVPLAALGAWLWGLQGLVGGIVAAEILTGLASATWVMRLYDRGAAKLAEEQSLAISVG
jgi:MATE family, multidrug efflux pump